MYITEGTISMLIMEIIIFIANTAVLLILLAILIGIASFIVYHVVTEPQ